MKVKLLIIAAISVLCVLAPQIANALNYEQISQIAKNITVLIDGCNSGSGVIYQRQGNNYYVLTAKHVFENSAAGCLAIAPDGTRYEINSSNIVPIANVDLAVFNFNSNQTYNLATIGNSQQVSSGKNIYVAGAPEPTAAIPKRTTLVVSGNVVARQSSQDGYELIYSNATNRGMSGGAVLDAQGQVIGIHGQGDRLNKEKTGFNLAIPIETFLTVDIGDLPKAISASNSTATEQPDVEVSYTTLQEQLKKLAWQEANETTVKLMLESVGRESQGWFTKESLAQLPCQALKAIDALWLKYSRYKEFFVKEHSRFGFSVQKNVFDGIVVAQGVRNADAFNKFIQNVGWSNYGNISYKLDSATPRGHLPALPGVLPLPEKPDSDPAIKASYDKYTESSLWPTLMFFFCLFIFLRSNHIYDFIVTKLLKIPQPEEYPKYPDFPSIPSIENFKKYELESNRHKLKLNEYKEYKKNRENFIKGMKIILAILFICLFLPMCSNYTRLNNEYQQKKIAVQQSIPTSGSKVLAGVEPLISTLDRCEIDKLK